MGNFHNADRLQPELQTKVYHSVSQHPKLKLPCSSKAQSVLTCLALLYDLFRICVWLQSTRNLGNKPQSVIP